MAERTNPHTEIVVGAKDHATPVFDQIVAGARRMGEEMEKQSKKGGDGWKKMGDPAPPAAAKVDSATRSIIQSVERATAAMKSGAKGGADYFEVLAKQRGVSGDVLAPYIKALREAEVAQQAALLGQQGMAMSAKQTAAALRGVPAQITDIVVSLQGGQAPLTVLLQQGGQLRDMFGGAGAAARALGSAVLGFLTPFTVLAATAGAAALAYRQGSKEAEAYTKALILSGNAAGTSADSLADMARAIDASNRGITQGKAAEVLNSIAASGDVAADKLQRYARAAIEFERAGGGASEEVAKAFSSLAGEPLAAVEKLNKSTHFLTAGIYHQIKALEDEGRSADAARLAQEAYAGMLDERIPKLNANLGLLEKGWQGITSAAAEAWDSMLNVGRSQTIGSRLESAQKLLADYENTMPGKRTTEQVARVQEAGGVDGLRSQIAGLQELMDTQRKADEQQRQNNLAAQAAIDLSKQASQHDSDLEKQRKAVAQATERYTQALTASNLSEAARARLEQDYLKTVSGITAAKEKRASAARKENKDLEAQARVFAELAGLSSTYHKELAAAQEQRAKGNLSEEQYIAYVGELIQKQPFAIALTKEETEAAKARAKAVAEQLAIQDELNAAYVQDSKAREAGRQAVGDYARGMDEASEALKYELSLMGLSQRERDVALEQYRIELDLKKQIAAVNANAGFTQSDRDDEIARLQAAGAIAKANAANKVFLDDWRQSVGQYDDIFRRGFADMLNNGKDGWKSFTRSLVTTFKTTVADQIYKMFAQPFVMRLVASLVGVTGGGIAGVASAATGGGVGAASNALSLASLGNNIYSAIQGGFTSLSGTVATQIQSGLNWLNGSGGMISQGPIQVGQAAQGLGAAAGYAAGIAGGVYGGRLLSGGYSAIGGASGNTAVNVGTAIGTIWGPIGSLVGGLVGGAINRAFGRKLADTGLEGTFGGDAGFDGRQFEFYKGGLFRSNKTSYSDLDEATRSGLADQFNAMRAGTKAMADVLGLGQEAIDGFTASIKVSLKDLSAEEADKKLREEFDKIADALAGTALGTEDYTRRGETAVQTLTRLSGSLTSVNTVLENLNATLYASSLAGADMASSLVDLFGDANGFNQATSAYFQNFYSADEQREAMRRSLQKALDGLDLQLPDIDASDARAQWKALADAQDLTTDAGRRAWSVLVQLSGAFAGVTQSAEDLARAAQQAARVLEKEQDLQIQLLRAQGRELEAVAIERQRELQAMAEFGPAAQGLQQQIWAVVDAANSAVGGLQSSFSAFTSLASTSASYGDVSGLQDYLGMLTGSYGNALGLAGQTAVLDAIAQTEQALAGAGAGPSATERAALTARQAALQEELRTAQNLLRVAQSLGDYVQSLYTGAQSGLSDADRMAALRGQYDTLLSAARGGDADAMGKLQGVSSEYLQLAQQLTGSQSDYSVLSGRIAAELGALSATTQASASSAERLAQQQLTALDTQLSALTGISRTTQDLTKQLLARARQQFEQDMKSATQQLIATDSVAAGLYRLPPELAAILSGSIASALGPALQSIASAVGSGARASSVTTLAGAVSTGQVPVDTAKDLAAGATGGPSDAYKWVVSQSGMTLDEFDQRLAANATSKYLSTGDGAGMVADMTTHGISMTDAARALGMTTGDVAAWLLEHGATKLPQLAVGTNYVPRDMLAQIHEGEAVVPKAFNPWAGGQGMQQVNAELIAEVRALRAEVAALKAPLQQTAAATTEHKQMFDNATAGGNAMAVEVMA